MKTLVLVAFAASIAFAQVKPGTVLLDDYSTNRLNEFNSNFPLTHIFLNEDPQQTGGVNTTLGFMRTVGSNNDGDCYLGCGHYWYFVEYPRAWPEGYTQYWRKSGTWDPNINRLYMKFKSSGRIPRRTDGGEMLQIGTYIRPRDHPDAMEQGPHYYHEVNVDAYPDRWVYVQLNGTPQAQRSIGAPVTGWVDPEYGAQGAHYFDNLGTFYFDTFQDWSGTTVDMDYMTMGYTPNAPDAYVASMTGTYSGTAYTMSFASFKDGSYTYLYDIRYSTSSMRANGWSTGTSGGTASSMANGYPQVNWTSPNMAEAQVLYVGVRPRMRVLSTTVSGTVRLNIHSQHYLTTGDTVDVASVCAAANGARTITVIDNDTISLDGTSGTCSYTSGGTVTATGETTNFSELLIGEASTGTPPNITTTTLPGGTVGSAYSQTLSATDGTAPYIWDTSAGTICTGLTLSSAGAITGTPTTAQTCSFTARVTDAGSQTDTQALSITVDAAPTGAPPRISGVSKFSGKVQVQ